MPGHRYAIGVHNLSGGRLLSVVSVDGINAVSGDTADWLQSGYALSPWQSFDVLGWRKSQSHVADFVFTSVNQSYAARTGRPDNVGVIGVAVFREAVPVPPPEMLNRMDPSFQHSPRAAERSAAGSAAPVAAPVAAADVAGRRPIDGALANNQQDKDSATSS
jgi:hypothetical protein